MKIKPIDLLLGEHEAFADLEPEDLELMAGCGHNEVVSAGTMLARDDEPADRFFVIRSGRLAIQLHGPGRPLLIDTAGPDQVVGWSWIFPPYLWTYDIEAVETTRLVSIDGRCLREKSEADPAFGYRIMKRFATLMAQRLEATQLRLLDLYGNG